MSAFSITRGGFIGAVVAMAITRAVRDPLAGPGGEHVAELRRNLRLLKDQKTALRQLAEGNRQLSEMFRAG